MISDFEYLYMLHQNSEDALDIVMGKFKRLLWKRAYELYTQQKPIGISIEDLFQEGFLGFYDAIYTFKEIKDVGFAYYVNLCVISTMRTALRKCRSQSYKLLDSKWSLDLFVTEDKSVYLADMIESQDITSDPVVVAHYQDARKIERKVLETISEKERVIYTMREEGFGYREIAERFNISPKNVDNIIQKVRRRLVAMRDVSHM